MAHTPSIGSPARSAALKFVLMIGVLSFFADFTYEGARSINGPFLAILGASATVVAVVAGLGELLGYGLRVFSGRLSERTGEFWPITFFGYIIQMASVPLLALAGTWQIAALLIITERIGKAIRNPPRDVMLSHAAREIGYGWGFGLHEALDQFGALFGPLLIAFVLSMRSDYHRAFAVLLVPGAIVLILLSIARWLYPRPEDLEPGPPPDVRTAGLPRVFWIYMAGAALVAAGFADFSLIAFHFEKTRSVAPDWVPILYAIAMGVSGAGSLLFGRVFDRVGISILVPLTIITLAFAPLVFLGNFWLALVGASLWGLGMGVHESIIPAAVATMVPPHRRPSAYGVFTAAYGIFWFLGSASMGVLYGISIPAVIAFCMAAQVLSIPFFLKVRRIMERRPA
jgi:predicted MFS family arabinose efflux permease